MSDIYKITIKGIKGAAYFAYKNDRIHEALFSFEDHFEHAFADGFPFNSIQRDILAHVGKDLEIKLLQPRTAQDKIVMFCMSFRQYRGTPYTPKKTERANIVQVSVTRELLDVYFKYTDFPLAYAKSIDNYIKHYNYIRDLAANGTPSRTRFPDVYDREFERGLEGETLSAYWMHLKKLGWTKTDGTWLKLGS